MKFTKTSSTLPWVIASLSLMTILAAAANQEITPGDPEHPSIDLWSVGYNPIDEKDVNTYHNAQNDIVKPNITKYENEGSLQPGFSRAASTFQLGQSFLGLSYSDNRILNDGNTLVPPDPICAAGKTRLVAAANSLIEIRDKQGELLYKDAFDKFFASLGPLGLLYDPKVVYDQYADRFLVVVLDRLSPGSLGPVENDRDRHLLPTNVTGNSTIMLAVSMSGSPSGVGDWYFQAINALEVDASGSYWADYPGFEISPEAVYVTAMMFTFSDDTPVASRLWIIGKTGFYSGGSLSYTKHDPYAGEYVLTNMPALVYGGPVGNTIGTFLVAYSGFSTKDGHSYLYVTTVKNPLNSPSFKSIFVDIGIVDDLSISIPQASQQGGDTKIECGDRRALDAAWYSNSLWVTTMVAPRVGANANQATAFWIRVNTGTSPFVMADKGEIGGEDIAPGTFTSYPSVAVNSQGVAAFGFSASGPSIFAGAYVVGRSPSDPPGTVSPSFVVHQGIAYYVRKNRGTRNRWGDYSGIAVDPVDDSFWVFNEFADARGFTASSGEDGVWNTAWARFFSADGTPQAPPTRAPTRRPTSRPTLKPTGAAPTVTVTVPPGFCFSEANSVHVEAKGMIKIKDLQIGDKVKDAHGDMVQVYSFGHFQPTARTKYLQLYIHGLPTPLEISEDHMVFVNGTAVPASNLVPGDSIDLLAASAQVQKVLTTVRNGVYAPFTTSGTIMVSGVAVSSYVTLQKNSSALILGQWETPLSMHWLCHVFQTPHRMMCLVFGMEFCRNVETYNADGISSWAVGPYSLFDWLLNQKNGMLVVAVFVPSFLIGLCLYALEIGWMYLAVMFGAIYVSQRKKMKVV